MTPETDTGSRTESSVPVRALRLDFALYLLSAAFAAVTAITSTLEPHRGWGVVAVGGYACAALAALAVLAGARWAGGVLGRAWLTGLTWIAVALVPLAVQAVQRAAGHPGRAQEEVLVTELAGRRLLDSGTPYLDRQAIAALPADERLLGYFPYQPGMAVFGLPRAVFGTAWWTDARVWFALATALALLGAGLALLGGPGGRGSGRRESGGRGAGGRGAAMVRAAQAATVLPICALTLATGGDDLPVLALCLLALALVDRRPGLAGLAVGSAGALKLFAWPVALVLLTLVLAAHRTPTPARFAVIRFAAAAFGIPALVLVPALLRDPAAAGENLLGFPLGRGLVTSPAQSPLPGYLLSDALPAGRTLAIGLLLAAGLAIATWLLRRPPRDAADAALVCAVGLVVAILLMPATRFGYLLYPIAYAVAVPALRKESHEAPARRTQVR